LERLQQKKLLREVIDRIVVDAEGNILRIDLLPPFAYLHDLACRTQSAAVCEAQKTKTSPVTGSCSTYVFSGGPEEIRTPDLYSAIVALSQLSYRPRLRSIVAVWAGTVKDQARLDDGSSPPKNR
jgi:hypothetical protein